MNKIILEGIAGDIEFLHKAYGEKFYKFCMDVERESGTHDVIPCVVSEIYADFVPGNKIKVVGELRTKNVNEGEKKHLIIFAHIQDVLPYGGYDENIVEMDGYIVRNPIYRETPMGRQITDILCASNRSYGKSSYIPCIAWGRNAKRASKLDVGTKISVTGRFQSREYEKEIDGETVVKTAYELSIATLDITDDE